MILQTKLPIKKESKNLINYRSNILLIGSCFSENIGEKLAYYKFQSIQNPFGILFHPKAIENFITNAYNIKKYSEKDLLFKNERWHSFEAHSSLSSSHKNELLENLNATILSTNRQLKKTTHIVITLGTSWIYRHIATHKIVANCHKISQKNFLKELLTIDEISTSLEVILALIKSINSEAIVLFTVSPVRHLKDGFVENQRSKSHLIAAIHNILYKNDTFYFPSYEIMMDELRDYRFYAQDMIHPNKTAINYIWNTFSETWFSDDAKDTMKEVETIQKGISHQPFHQKSKEHQEFLKTLELKQKKLKSKFSHIQF